MRERDAARDARLRNNPAGTYGERPPSPFGGLPIAEVAIFAGAVGLIVGVLQGGDAAAVVGVIVCGLGVVEVTAREHFSGYRSHAILLAAAASAVVAVVVVVVFGEPGTRNGRELLVLGLAPVFAVMFLLLRRRFRKARQSRVAASAKGLNP